MKHAIKYLSQLGLFGCFMVLFFLPPSSAASTHARTESANRYALQADSQPTSAKAPDGRWALLLMGIFAIWAVGVYATWEEQPVPADIATAEEKVLALNRAWAEAEVRHDEATIRHILHDRFVFTDEDGKQMSKSDLIMESRGLALHSQTLDHQTVTIENGRAMVAGTGKMQFRSVGPLETLTYGFTCIYVQENGEWKVVEQKLARVAPVTPGVHASLLQGSRAKTPNYASLPIAS